MRAVQVEGQARTIAKRSVAVSHIDIIPACRTNASILFTGSTANAESVARDIHNESGWRHGPFVVIDCRMRESELSGILSWTLCDELRSADSAEPMPCRSQNGTVFLRDVDALSPVAQLAVFEWLQQLRSPVKPSPRCRVMASSAGSLVPRGLGGSFHDGLYYRLNAIHIKLGPTPES
jgi:DNA-binding NtrC family response regulator